MDRDDDKADGVLNGPTTEAWFDHWYRHLVELEFASSAVGLNASRLPSSTVQSHPTVGRGFRFS